MTPPNTWYCIGCFFHCNCKVIAGKMGRCLLIFLFLWKTQLCNSCSTLVGPWHSSEHTFKCRFGVAVEKHSSNAFSLQHTLYEINDCFSYPYTYKLYLYVRVGHMCYECLQVIYLLWHKLWSTCVAAKTGSVSNNCASNYKLHSD